MFRILSLILIPLCLALFFYWRRFMKRAVAEFSVTGRTRSFLLWAVPLAGAAAMLGAFSAAGILYLHLVLISMLTGLLARFVRNDKLRKLLRTGLPALALTLLVGVYAYFNMCTVRETDYTVPTAKPLSRSYTVVLVADTHYGNSLNAARVRDMCERIDALRPDALLLGGDIVDESTPKDGVSEIFSLFGQVKTTFGVYYVSGNHDRGTYRRGANNDIEAALAGTGITFLRDETVPLGDELLLVGRRDAGDRARLGIEELLSGADKARFILVLDHQPREYARNAGAGADLILSGHTHAGQIFPAGFLTTLFGSEINYGMTETDGMTGIVTSGASGWGFPLRTSRHSEFVCVKVANGHRH